MPQQFRLKEFFSIMLVLTGGRLSGQTPAERHFLDSLLIVVSDAQPYRNIPPPSVCAGHERAMLRLCEALLTVRTWKIPIVVPEVRPYMFGPAEEAVGRDGIRHLARTALTARTLLDFVFFERPKWAPPYFLLSQIVFNDYQIDSAVALLHTAKRLTGMAPGLIDLSLARAEFARGDRSAGWADFLAGASDTNVVSQEFTERILAHFLTSSVVGVWKGKTIQERVNWLRSNGGVGLTLMDGMSFSPAFEVRTRSYGEERNGGRFVAAFSVSINEMVGDTLSVPGKVVYPVRTRLVAQRESDGLEMTMDTTRHFVPFNPPPLIRAFHWVGKDLELKLSCPKGLDGKLTACMHLIQDSPPPVQWLASFAEMALPPGRWDVTLTLSQAKSTRGVTVLLPTAEIRAAEPKQLTMTDLILGANESNLNWQSASKPIPLNPYGEWVNEVPMTMYSQLSGVTPDADYKVQIRFSPLDPKRANDSKGVVTFAFSEKADASTVDWFKEVSMKQLKCGGPYRVEVTMSQGEQKVSRSEDMKVRC